MEVAFVMNEIMSSCFGSLATDAFSFMKNVDFISIVLLCPSNIPQQKPMLVDRDRINKLIVFVRFITYILQ